MPALNNKVFCWQMCLSHLTRQEWCAARMDELYMEIDSDRFQWCKWEQSVKYTMKL